MNEFKTDEQKMVSEKIKDLRDTPTLRFLKMIMF
jgi:hypothetical protein